MTLGKHLNRKTRRLIRCLLQLPEKSQYLLADNFCPFTENHRRIFSLRNKYIGQRCFIIGSGPSIKKMDLSPLKNEITFGFNAFFLLAESLGFLPTYYLVEDNLPAEDNAEMINALKGTTKIFPQDLNYCLKKDPHTIYVHFDRYSSDPKKAEFPGFSDNALRCVYWGGTVAYMALELAYYMGIREVYLIGIDLDYKVPANLKGSIIMSKESDVSHFHPDYFGPGKRWHHPRVERMQQAFEKADGFYRANDGIIHNATVGGNLKGLERKNYKDLFK